MGDRGTQNAQIPAPLGTSFAGITRSLVRRYSLGTGGQEAGNSSYSVSASDLLSGASSLFLAGSGFGADFAFGAALVF
jgi:hypothetical protein